MLGTGGHFTNKGDIPYKGQYWKVIQKHWAYVPCCNQELQPKLQNWGTSQSYKKQVKGIQGLQQGILAWLPNGILLVAATLERPQTLASFCLQFLKVLLCS